MKESDFMKYEAFSKQLKYDNVPDIPSLRRRRSQKSAAVKVPPEIASLIPKILPNLQAKNDAIKKIKPSMLQIDQDFYQALLHI